MVFQQKKKPVWLIITWAVCSALLTEGFICRQSKIPEITALVLLRKITANQRKMFQCKASLIPFRQLCKNTISRKFAPCKYRVLISVKFRYRTLVRDEFKLIRAHLENGFSIQLSSGCKMLNCIQISPLFVFETLATLQSSECKVNEGYSMLSPFAIVRWSGCLVCGKIDWELYSLKVLVSRMLFCLSKLMTRHWLTVLPTDFYYHLFIRN